MEDTLYFIEDCSQSFHCYYNLGEKNMLGNKPTYSKLAVEKFIFNKIYPLIYELYNKRYEKDNEKFLAKQSIIRTKNNYDEIMAYLEVIKIFYK